MQDNRSKACMLLLSQYDAKSKQLLAMHSQPVSLPSLGVLISLLPTLAICLPDLYSQCSLTAVSSHCLAHLRNDCHPQHSNRHSCTACACLLLQQACSLVGGLQAVEAKRPLQVVGGQQLPGHPAHLLLITSASTADAQAIVNPLHIFCCQVINLRHAKTQVGLDAKLQKHECHFPTHLVSCNSRYPIQSASLLHSSVVLAATHLP